MSDTELALAGATGDGWVPGAKTDPLVRAVFAALVLACFGAFFLTQRLKHTPTVITNPQMEPRFSPYPAGRHKQEAISFKLTRADRITVAIVDSGEHVVATLISDYPVARYKQFSLRWNGRLGAAAGYRVSRTETGHAIYEPLNRGALAPPGEYHVQVTLHEQGDRRVLLPRGFTLVAG